MEGISSNLKKLAKLAVDHGERIYVVGGYIRNKMLDSYKTDIDLSGTCDPEGIQKLAGLCGFKCQVINEKLGSCLLTLNQEQYEYTPFRRDIYSDGGFHTPERVEFVKDIEVDVARRDFTINTIYYDIEQGGYIDIFNAKRDIKHRLIKCIISPRHVFGSDGLRILRLVRFTCELDLNIERETFRAASRYAFQLKDISKERILKELKLMITSDTRNDLDDKVHVRALRLLNQLGLWRYIFNSDYKKFKVTLHGEVFNMYKNSKPEDRFNAFICLVFYSIFKSFMFNDQLIDFYLNNLLGVDGLKIPKSIGAIKSMILVLRDLTNRNNTPYDYNRLCISYHNLSDQSKAIISSGFDMQEIDEHIHELHAKKVPFKVGDVNITSQDLMELNIPNKSLSKVYSLIMFELINESLNNTKEDIIDFVKTKLSQFIK